ncbi:MAG TPA: PEGA domain-containing protein [Polyangiales bacterium]
MTLTLADDSALAQEAASPVAVGSSVALRPAGAPTTYDAAISAALADALHQRGHQVLPPAQTNRELARLAPGLPCAPPSECDYNAMLHTLGVDALVVYTLRMQDGHAVELGVRVVTKDGQGYASQPALGHAVKPLVQGVLAQALADAERSASVRVTIGSEPSGALVSVDGDAPAPAPRSLALSRGRHELVAKLKDYAVAVEPLDLAGDATQREVVVHLSPATAQHTSLASAAASARPEASVRSDAKATQAPDGAVVPTPDAREPASRASASAWNYVVAGVLAAGAATLAVSAVAAAGREGDCTGARDPQGRCGERVALGPLFWSSVALGAASLAGAAVVLVFEPIHGTTDARLGGLRLQWRRSF